MEQIPSIGSRAEIEKQLINAKKDLENHIVKQTTPTNSTDENNNNNNNKNIRLSLDDINFEENKIEKEIDKTNITANLINNNAVNIITQEKILKNEANNIVNIEDSIVGKDINNVDNNLLKLVEQNEGDDKNKAELESLKKELVNDFENLRTSIELIREKSESKEVKHDISNEAQIIMNIVKEIQNNKNVAENQKVLMKHLNELSTDFNHDTVGDIIDQLDIFQLLNCLQDFTVLKSDTSYRTNAFDFFCFEVLDCLSVYAKASIVLIICYLYHQKTTNLQEMIWITKIICSTTGQELLSLKNKIDYFAGKHNFHKIIFYYLQEVSIRKTILEHLTKFKASPLIPHSTRSPKPIKILSDIDDTMISSGGSLGGWDARYPWGTVYPGVISFYRELDRGFAEEHENEESNLVFLTARPQQVEDNTYAKFSELHEKCRKEKNAGFHTNSIILTGGLMQGIKSAWGNFSGIIEGKMANFAQYASIYPDCNYVFIGDNGQGDYAVGKEMLKANKSTLDVFIHEVMPKENTFGYTKENPDLYFFKTYIGAAVIAYNLGYFKEESLLRIIEETKSEFIRFEIVYLEESLMKGSRKREMMKSMVSMQGHVHQNSVKNIVQIKTELNNDIKKAIEVLKTDIELLYV